MVYIVVKNREILLFKDKLKWFNLIIKMCNGFKVFYVKGNLKFI